MQRKTKQGNRHPHNQNYILVSLPHGKKIYHTCQNDDVVTLEYR